MRVSAYEDDLIAARGIILMLKAGGAVVDNVDIGEEGLELARHYDYDIVLLDLMLPDIEGFEVVRRMRVSRNDTPVLILSGLSRPQAKVKGFGSRGGRLHHQAVRQGRIARPNAGHRSARQGVGPPRCASARCSSVWTVTRCWCDGKRST